MILNHPYEFFLYSDEEGRFKYVNNALASYLSSTKDILIGKKINFKFDKELSCMLKTPEYDLLSLHDTGNRRLIASRWPVFEDEKFVGICARYLSIDAIDVKKNTFGNNYLDLISRLKVRDIQSNVDQLLIELESYRDDFIKTNTPTFGINNIIGSSKIIDELKRKALIVSQSPSSVVLTGESGTGKEIFAKAIHFHGNRTSYPFVKINFAAIPENLLEAELFGYIDGAFTGARKGGRMGKFELANNGTIFLDEIGDMPLSMQVKLLRVLQEKEIERLGSESTIQVDVRVISATNKDLLAMIKEG